MTLIDDIQWINFATEINGSCDWLEIDAMTKEAFVFSGVWLMGWFGRLVMLNNKIDLKFIWVFLFKHSQSVTKLHINLDFKVIRVRQSTQLNCDNSRCNWAYGTYDSDTYLLKLNLNAKTCPHKKKLTDCLSKS